MVASALIYTGNDAAGRQASCVISGSDLVKMAIDKSGVNVHDTLTQFADVVRYVLFQHTVLQFVIN